MILQHLKLNQFRNYSDESVDFSPHINVITGSNAQGKTNLLESVFFLSRGYSHRASTIHELVNFDQDGFCIEGDINREEIHHKVGVRYEKQKKTVIIDGKRERRQENLTKVLSTILFEPEDLRIVKAGPEKRRRFMDEEITGYLPAYSQVLRNYKKALFQRNALLKELYHNPSMSVLLDSWDQQLVEYGSKLMAYRISYLKRLGPYAGKLHAMMSQDQEHLSLFYQNNIITELSQTQEIVGRFMDCLKSSQQQDIERGSTSFGPHVDDIIIHINGKEARKFSSQGQQRTAAIAMKLSQIEIYRQQTGDYPIVLLDDILSELDSDRQEKILSVLGQTQAFITCTDPEFSMRYDPDQLKILSICNGHIQK